MNFSPKSVVDIGSELDIVLWLIKAISYSAAAIPVINIPKYVWIYVFIHI